MIPGIVAAAKVLAAGGVGDPHFLNVVLLMHFEGTDGSTTFTDVIGHTMTAVGNAQIDTSDPLTGTASGLFDGTGDAVTTPEAAEFNGFTISDTWTIEVQAKRSVANSGILLCLGDNAGGLLAQFSLETYAGQQNIYLRPQAGTVGYWKQNAYTFSTAKTSYAFVCDAGTLYIFVDGVSVGALSSFAWSTDNMPYGAIVGAGYLAGITSSFAGMIDELRVTKGIARYTANYTPEAGAFPDVWSQTDPYISQTVLGLHFDGADGSTTFTDYKSHTVTPAGNAQIDTAWSLFGSGSGLFDGTGDYLTVADSSDWDFGSGKFCMEGTIKPGSLSSDFGVISKRASGANYAPFSVSTNAVSGKLDFVGSTTGTSWNISLSSTTTLSVGSVYKWAVTRDGNVFRLFINGVLEASTTVSGALMTNTAALSIGAYAADGSGAFNGAMDELRITKGAARYVTNYTPSPIAFPES